MRASDENKAIAARVGGVVLLDTLLHLGIARRDKSQLRYEGECEVGRLLKRFTQLVYGEVLLKVPFLRSAFFCEGERVIPRKEDLEA